MQANAEEVPAELPRHGLSHSYWRWACIDEMQMVFQTIGLDAVLMQLDGGSCLGGRLLILDVPPLQLMRFQLDKSLHTIGSKPKGMFSVTIDLDPHPFDMPWRSHGQAVPIDSLFGVDMKIEIHFTVPANVNIGIIFMPVDALRDWATQLGWPGFAGDLLPQGNVLLTDQLSTNGLRNYLQRLFVLAEQDPARLRHPGTQRLMREDMIPLLLEALVSGSGQTKRTIRPPARIEIVKDVQRWLHAHPTLPVTLADLCREAHACRRTLIQGFREHLGMGPMAYVKVLRLHGIRRQLLQAEPDELLIGAVAETWGFHNAGHFAADYRRFFGESPRVTLQRSLRRLS